MKKELKRHKEKNMQNPQMTMSNLVLNFKPIQASLLCGIKNNFSLVQALILRKYLLMI